jgi:hypothetical protein
MSHSLLRSTERKREANGGNVLTQLPSSVLSGDDNGSEENKSLGVADRDVKGLQLHLHLDLGSWRERVWPKKRGESAGGPLKST